MATAWILDSNTGNLNLASQCSPNIPVTLCQVEALGVFTRRIDAKSLHEKHPNDTEGRTVTERLVWNLGYKAHESVDTIVDEAEEHLNLDEQMRIIESSIVYIDLRDASDRWIRLEAKEGDVVTIPRGIYHRLTPAAAEAPVRVLRLLRHSSNFAPHLRTKEASAEVQTAVDDHRNYVAHPPTETVMGPANTVDNILITTPRDFDETTEKVKAKLEPGDVLVLLFKGASDRKTHVSWCPPCVVAGPMVRNAICAAREKSSKRVVYVECLLERCVYLGNPDHPYRKHPFIGIVSIPYLVVLQRNDVDFKELRREEDPGERYESWVNEI